jgi:hypothetical protein
MFLEANAVLCGGMSPMNRRLADDEPIWNLVLGVVNWERFFILWA